MRKINLIPYQVRAGVNPETGENIFAMYSVKTSIENVMLAAGPQTTQQLSMVELLRRADVARKIADCLEDFILIEEHEYQMVKAGFDAFKGYSINEVEMCRRIENAETVEVTEKKDT